MFSGNIGVQELLLILLIVLLLFGARRIPEIGRALGRGIREFKQATREISSDVDARDASEGKTAAKAPPPREGEPRATEGRSPDASESKTKAE